MFEIHMKASNGQMIKTKNQIFDKIHNSKNLPSLPQVLLKLIESCNNEETPLTELSEIISQDPSISAKVIRLMNSSFFASNKKFTSLQQAVVYLGADAVKNIAISASVQHIFSDAVDNQLFRLGRFWWHSFMCASLARRLAALTDYEFLEEAFLSGLLHNIGELLLWVNFKKEYTSILKVSNNYKEILITEKERLGVTHCEIGSWLIRQWKLRSFLADAVLYHHEQLDRIAYAFPLVKIVYTASALSHNFSDGGQTGIFAAETLFGLDKSQIDEITSKAKEEVEEVAQSLDIRLEAPQISTDPKDVQNLDKNRELLHEVKNISMLSGTLQNFLKADKKDLILKTVEQSLKILFNVNRVFIFLYNSGNNHLVGFSTGENPDEDLIHNLKIPLISKSGFVVRSFAKRIAVDSFGYLTNAVKTLADEQIVNLLGTEGMICFPLAVHKKSVGVVVIGVSESQYVRLSNSLKLLSMLMRQAAMCIYVCALKQQLAERLQSERIEAVSMIVRF